MANLTAALKIGQSVGTPSGPDYVTYPAGAPVDPVASVATVLSDMDTLGAAIVAISGDTYSATTHQFTLGGSTGLTSAQLHTQLTSLNALITALLAAQASVTGGDMILSFNGTKFTSKNQVLVAGRRLLSLAAGLVSL